MGRNPGQGEMADEKASQVATIPRAKAVAIVRTEFVMPAILEAAPPKTRKRVLEFFGASIRNENTRKAYMKACTAFFDFLEDNEIEALEDIEPLHVAAYLEAMQAARRSIPTQKQQLAAIRMLLDYLVTGGFLAHNPALSVRAPRQSNSQGQDPYPVGRRSRRAAALDRNGFAGRPARSRA